VDLVKGASILAARIANAKPRADREWLQWSPEAAEDLNRRCDRCGGAIAEVLAALGSLRCHDCRTGHADD
jgi:hypothetical protein